jgi:hypothetical protein
MEEKASKVISLRKKRNARPAISAPRYVSASAKMKIVLTLFLPDRKCSLNHSKQDQQLPRRQNGPKLETRSGMAFTRSI